MKLFIIEMRQHRLKSSPFQNKTCLGRQIEKGQNEARFETVPWGANLNHLYLWHLIKSEGIYVWTNSGAYSGIQIRWYLSQHSQILQFNFIDNIIIILTLTKCL